MPSPLTDFPRAPNNRDPGKPESPIPGRQGPQTPYPVNDPGISDPDKPGSEPDYLPGKDPGTLPQL